MCCEKTLARSSPLNKANNRHDAIAVLDLHAEFSGLLQLTSDVCCDGAGVCEKSRRLIRHRIRCEIKLAYVPEVTEKIKIAYI